jgi:cytochrome c553
MFCKMTRYLLVAGLLLTATASVLAQSDSLYFPCRTCHGDSGEGYAARNAPALAGQSADYLARQLENFRDGKRGKDERDTWGRQMALMVANIETSSIRELSEFIADLPPWPGGNSDSAPDSSMQREFSPCSVCHGSRGEGNPAFNAPRIAGLDDRYIARQLRNFRDGIRGSQPGDVYGNQMRAAVPPQWDEDMITSLAGYISGLQP